MGAGGDEGVAAVGTLENAVWLGGEEGGERSEVTTAEDAEGGPCDESSHLC